MYIEYKSGQKHALKNAEISNDDTYFKDAGWLLTDDDLVVDIDCLNLEIIKMLIKYFNIRTRTVWTDRGVHLYFKKPLGFRGAAKICPLGFKIEYKHTGNTKSCTIKRNGKHRKVERNDVRQELPEIFQANRKFESLLGLSENDGRNNALFSHRGRLAGYSEEKRILYFINQYIFADPLDQNEFELIMRDKGFEAVKNGEYLVATKMIKDFNACVYKNELYCYNGLKYDNDELSLKHMIYNIVGDQKTAYVDEVCKQMLYRGKKIPLDTVFNIKFNNGILMNGEFVEIEDYKEFTPYYIELDYKPEAEPVEIVDNYVAQLTNNDEKYRDLLFEILAHGLITDPEVKRSLAKFFIFVGDGGNGKGTLLSIIRSILTRENCSGLKIKQMSDERYAYSMDGKLVNLGDDIQDQPINDKDMEMLKNISTCDYVEIRKMFKNSTSATMTTSLIFTSNHILKSWEKGESYKRRVLWLPMYSKPKRKDPKFITKLTTQKALEYWLKLIIDGYKRLYQNGDFTACNIVEEFNRQYHEENNGAEIYVKDLTKEYIIGKTNQEIYLEFEQWCEENDLTASKKMLRDAIYNIHKLKIKVIKRNKKTFRAFQEVEENKG